MNKSFYNKVINLIPSNDLKQCVKMRNFQFGEKELLKLILDYAPYFEKKLELFQEAAEVFSDKDARFLAQRRIAHERKMYEAFMRESDGLVFETKIKLSPDDAEEETYITRTFGDAISVIKSFLKCYEISAKESVHARYTVKKKTTAAPKKPNDIYKHKVGTVGECVLDNKFRIIYLDADGFRQEVPCKKVVFCNDCQRCIDMIEPRYPSFLKKYDLVAYYDDYLYDPSHVTYGILCCDMDEYDTDSYFLEIVGNKYIKERNIDYRDEEGYFRVYDCHEHPDYCRIIKLQANDVPKDIYEDYLYAVDGLKRIEESV